MKSAVARILFSTALLASIIVTYGCSTLPQVDPNSLPPLRTFESIVRADGPNLLEVDDSIEGFNRGSYRFNYYFDKYFFLPVVDVYEFVTPDYAQKRVSNFVGNIGEFGNLTNNLFQLKIKSAGITLSRIIINSTIGVAGLWDPAAEWGLTRRPEDFGRTLGYYGAGNGSYVVLPVLGPSNVRDTAGFIVDLAASSFIGPAAWVDDIAATTAYTGTAAVDKRHRISFRYRQTGSPFEYEMVRMLYTMKHNAD